jgi:hypothetical protein
MSWEQTECPNCREANALNRDTCHSCNAPLARREPYPQSPSRQQSTSHQFGIVFAVSGVVLLVFGALRWSSASSQIIRAFGGSDNFAVLLFILGAGALAMGVYILNTFPAARIVETISRIRPQSEESGISESPVEQRLRQLDDLKVKGLLSESEYVERKAAIIATL